MPCLHFLTERLFIFPADALCISGKDKEIVYSSYRRKEDISLILISYKGLKIRGVNLLSEIFFSSESEVEVLENESKAIISIGKIGNGGILFNQTEGGEGSSGYIHSSDAIGKMSLFRTGRLATQETKDKMSRARKGVPHPQVPGRLAASKKEKTASGEYDHIIPICIDGITDSIHSHCERMGIDDSSFRRLRNNGISDQEIADKMRIKLGKGHRLFPKCSNRTGFRGGVQERQ